MHHLQTDIDEVDGVVLGHAVRRRSVARALRCSVVVGVGALQQPVHGRRGSWRPSVHNDMVSNVGSAAVDAADEDEDETKYIKGH
jgi:hypothetical protein